MDDHGFENYKSYSIKSFLIIINKEVLLLWKKKPNSGIGIYKLEVHKMFGEVQLYLLIKKIPSYSHRDIRGWKFYLLLTSINI